MDNLKLAKTRNRRGERGSILAASALGMLSFILAVGLGVDISHLYLAKNELQNAADSAALAGASGLDYKPSGITRCDNPRHAGHEQLPIPKHEGGVHARERSLRQEPF